jgi:CubicO group peptidase (beta-lactamase class C family)
LPSTVDLIFQEQANGVDKVLAVPLRWGMGFALPTREVAHLVPNGRACFWGGWGGSIVVMDLDRRTTIAYTMNKMAKSLLGGARTSRYLALVYDAIK